MPCRAACHGVALPGFARGVEVCVSELDCRESAEGQLAIGERSVTWWRIKRPSGSL